LLDNVNLDPKSFLEYMQKYDSTGLEELIIIKGDSYIQYKP